MTHTDVSTNLVAKGMWPFQIQDETQKDAPDNIVGDAAALEQADAEWPFSKAASSHIQEEMSGNFVIRGNSRQRLGQLHSLNFQL